VKEQIIDKLKDRHQAVTFLSEPALLAKRPHLSVEDLAQEIRQGMDESRKRLKQLQDQTAKLQEMARANVSVQ